MNPSVDDRLSSVLRALETVVLPALPAGASLAQEQVMLAIGQIQIVQVQRHLTPAYEQGELDDINAMASALLAAPGAPDAVSQAREKLAAALQIDTGQPGERAEAIRMAIDGLLVAAGAAQASKYHRALSAIILPLGRARAGKDREWFALMEFDIELGAG